MRAYEERLRAGSNINSAWIMKLAGVQPGDGGNLLLLKKDMKLAFKRHFILEEWDLHPVPQSLPQLPQQVLMHHFSD